MAQRQEDYIIVSQPDRGLANHIPPSDISPRHCSDCKNIWFENGLLKKRFGSGSAITIKDASSPPVAVEYGREITHMVTHEFNHHETAFSKALYAITLDFLLKYDPSDDEYDLQETDTVTILYTTSDPVADIETGGDMYYYHSVGSGDDDFHPQHTYPGADDKITITIDAEDTPDTFAWTATGGGSAAGVAITGDQQRLEPTLNDVWIMFEGDDNHTLNDAWVVQYDDGYSTLTIGPNDTLDNPGGATPAYPPNMRIQYLMASGVDLQSAKTLSIQVQAADAYAAGELSIVIYDNDATTHYGAQKGTRIPLTAYSGSSGWEVLTASFTALGATYNGSKFITIEDSTGTGPREMEAIRVKNLIITGLGYGLDADSTKTSPTVSRSVSLNPVSGGDVENVLFFVNADKAGHAVRYVTSSASNTKLMGADGTGAGTGYNDDRDEHICRAISGYGRHLHLLGPTEEEAAAAEYEIRDRDRWSDQDDAYEWGAGTATFRNLTDTSGELLNATQYDGDEYYLKSDSIIRVTHLDGEQAVFDYNVAYQVDGLIAPKFFHTDSEGISFVGHNNVWRFSGTSNPDRIGDAVQEDLFSKLEYSNGEFHRRSHCVDINEKALTMFLVPSASAYPDVAYVLDREQGTWTFWDFTSAKSISAGASFNRLSGTNLQRGTHIGSGDGFIYAFDFDATLDNGATAIDAYWDSKLFGVYEGAWPELTDWTEFWFRAKGDNVTVSYSTDLVTWTEMGSVSLTSTLVSYYMRIDKTSELIAIRFADATASSTFEVEKFGLGHKIGGIQAA